MYEENSSTQSHSLSFPYTPFCACNTATLQILWRGEKLGVFWQRITQDQPSRLDDHLASPQPTEPAPVPSDFLASDEAEKQMEAESPTTITLQAEPAKEMAEEQADDALD